MLLLLIVGFIATGLFYRTAASNGYHPGKAATAPMLGLMLILIVNHALMTALLFVLSQFGVGTNVQSWIVSLNGLFVLGIYLVFLRENYNSINEAE